MTRTATVLLILSLGTGVSTYAQGQEEMRPLTPFGSVMIEPSEREFLNSCASCHGRDAKGAGFLTRIFRGADPGDLTQLSARNDGTFPMERVFSIIDGRTEVSAHGERQMPVWGDRYMSDVMSEYGPDEMNELRVRNRLYELVHYLQSIQVVNPEAEE